MEPESPKAVSERVRRLYQGAPFLPRSIQVLRPYICPFGQLVEFVPQGSRVLEVGCNTGLLLGLLADRQRIYEGYGFDANHSAVELAALMRRNLGAAAPIAVEQRDRAAGWPDGEFDVVLLIDYMHHVSPADQPQTITTAAQHLKKGGILIYKDMVRRPLWRAWANKLHDLVLAREWIHYAPLAMVRNQAQKVGLEIIETGQANMFWYGHEWLVCRRIS